MKEKIKEIISDIIKKFIKLSPFDRVGCVYLIVFLGCFLISIFFGREEAASASWTYFFRYWFCLGIGMFIGSYFITKEWEKKTAMSPKKKECLSLCNRYKDQDGKDNCCYDFAKTNPDSSICDEIKNKQKRDKCYWIVANKKQDLSLCWNIVNPVWRGACFGKFAETKQDLSICERIKDFEARDSCYAIVALGKRDKFICDKIHNQEMKDLCYKSVDEAK